MNFIWNRFKRQLLVKTAQARATRPYRPILESLEDRTAPAVLTVTSAADDGSAGTLRYEVSQANTDAAANQSDTIVFSGVSAVTLTAPLTLQTPNSATKITINGAISGGGSVQLSGNSAANNLSLTSGSAELENLSITNVSGAPALETGAGCSLFVSACTVSGNSAASGAGLFNSGAATISASTFSGNSASASGGAIESHGTLIINSSTFSGNSAVTLGGAIDCATGTLTMSDSTVAGNSVSTGTAGGISSEGTAPVLVSCIVGANNAPTDNDCNFTFDLSSSSNLIGDASGVGGIYNGFDGNIVGATSTQIGLASLANNGGPTETMALLPGSLALGNGSAPAANVGPLSVSATQFTVTNASLLAIIPGTSVLLVGSEQMLVTGVSQNTLTVQRGYHGTTAAQHPAFTSVYASPFDQRGQPRLRAGQLDIGAYEAPISAAINANISSLLGVQRSMVDDIVYTFNQEVTLSAGAFTISLHAGVTVDGVADQTVGTLPTLNWSSPDGGTTWIVTFSGAGVVGNSIADGVYDITIHAADVTAVGGGPTYVADQTNTFFRLFGDSNGDGVVTSTGVDETAFASTFGSSVGEANYLAYFDYNADGSITGRPDVQNFVLRYGTSFTLFTPTI